MGGSKKISQHKHRRRGVRELGISLVPEQEDIDKHKALLAEQPFPSAQESWRNVYRASKKAQIRTELEGLSVGEVREEAAEYGIDTSKKRKPLVEELVNAKYLDLAPQSPTRRRKMHD